MPAEKVFENKVKAFLKENGCWFVKYWSGKSATGQTFTRSGVPDILCCCNGYFLGIEIKASNGKPSELQLHNLRQIDKSGGFGILLYPNQFCLFKQFVENLNQDFGWGGIYQELKGKWMK